MRSDITENRLVCEKKLFGLHKAAGKVDWLCAAKYFSTVQTQHNTQAGLLPLVGLDVCSVSFPLACFRAATQGKIQVRKCQLESFSSFATNWLSIGHLAAPGVLVGTGENLMQLMRHLL